MPFVEDPPPLQLLQCMRPADIGGDSMVADAKLAAEYFKSTNRREYELLTTTKLR